MDKYYLIQQKLKSFFEKEILKNKIDENKLKLIISFESNLFYELWEHEKIGERKINDIISLNGIESLLVSENKIEQTIIEAINKLAIEQNSNSNEIQIIILPGNRYCLFKNKKYVKEIKLNEII